MAKKPAVLLISPGILRWIDMDFGLPHLVSLGGYLREHTGVRVEILDLNYEASDHRTLLQTIEDLGPFLVIGISTYSSFDYMRSMTVARFLEQRFPDVPFVSGGYHASALPDDVVFDGSPFDAVILGEGERPMARIVRTLLGGGKLDRDRYGPDLIDDLDDLPPYDWGLLARYWPRARQLGRKFQIYLSRGCPYRCTFCMERAKSGYRWRAYSPGRAVDELERLATFTDLGHWVINIADPLFGFRRGWRREVLEGIVARGLLPRQYWTLTRSDDLDETDIDLLARARFSIGIGLESGSPEMLEHMQKGNTPERYLGAVERLARLSHEHGLTWAVNVIVGHPGETPASMQQTLDFVTALFTRENTTRGWLSVDPFRLYPGSAVHEQIGDWEARFGAVFFQKEWWKSWYDEGFLAQHLDPGRSLDYEARVRFMHDRYAPLIADIQRRFTGQGRSVDAVYQRSIANQLDALTPARRDALIKRGREARSRHVPDVRVPLGINLKDPWVRDREQAVRRLLDAGTLRSADLIEALLQVGPERFLGPDEARAVLADRPLEPIAEGLLPPGLGISLLAAALEVLEPEAGDTVVDCTARSGYVPALLSHLVGPRGWVHAMHPAPASEAGAFLESLAPFDNVEAHCVGLDGLLVPPGPVDRALVAAALPRFPPTLLSQLRPGGRVVGFLGPRFRRQDLVVQVRRADGMEERIVARCRVPVLAGPGGWIAKPAEVPVTRGGVAFERRSAPALLYWILSHVDLSGAAADLYHPARGRPAWAERLRVAYDGADGRLAVQVGALAFGSAEAWLHALGERPPGEDEAQAALVAALRDAAEAEAPGFLERWRAEGEVAERRVAEVRAALATPLTRLRERLWEASGRPPPPLSVVDCRALGPAGRATTVRGERIVAVSLDQGLDHVLCQVLHEEIHPITDPLVLGDRERRDTRGPVHRELEAVAVAATEAFLTEKAPELLPDFRRWKSRAVAAK